MSKVDEAAAEALAAEAPTEEMRTWKRPVREGAVAADPAARVPSGFAVGTSKDDRHYSAKDKLEKRLTDSGMNAEQAHRKAAEIARDTDRRR